MKKYYLFLLVLINGVTASLLTMQPALSLGSRTYIADVTGNVLIKRRLWFGYRKANVNDSLWNSDSLWIRDADSSALVICHSDAADTWQVPHGRQVSVNEGCLNTPYRVEDTRPPGRDPINDRLPYVIRSRNSRLFKEKPLKLSWNSVEGATYYKVEIRDFFKSVIEETVFGTEIEFADLAHLDTDSAYSVIVTANTGLSAPEDPEYDSAPKISFINIEDTILIQRQLDSIEALRLSDETTVFARADLYRRYRLYQDATDILEEAIQSGSESAAIHELNAEIYLLVGLERHAINSFVDALDLLESARNIEQQAEIQEKLGRLSRNLVDYESAATWLSMAKENYEEILNLNVVESRELISELDFLIRDSQDRLYKQ